MNNLKAIDKLQNKLQQLPTKEYLFGSLLLLLLAIKFVVFPLNAYLTEKQQELQQLADNIKSKKLIEAEIQKLKQEQTELTQEAQQWQSQFYLNNPARVKLSVVSKMTELGENNDLIIISTRWMNASRKSDVNLNLLRPLKLTTTIRGEYNKIKNFLLELQKSTPILELAGWRIREGGTSGVVMLKLDLQVYYANSEGAFNDS